MRLSAGLTTTVVHCGPCPLWTDVVATVVATEARQGGPRGLRSAQTPRSERCMDSLGLATVLLVMRRSSVRFRQAAPYNPWSGCFPSRATPGDEHAWWPLGSAVPSFRHLVPLHDRLRPAGRKRRRRRGAGPITPLPARAFAALIQTLHAQRGARSRVAVDAARAAGRVPGRRTLLTLEMEDRLELLLRQGTTVSAAASAVGLSEMTVYRWLRRQRTPG